MLTTAAIAAMLKRILSWSEDKTLRWWDAATGGPAMNPEFRFPLQGQTAPARRAWARAGRTLSRPRLRAVPSQDAVTTRVPSPLNAAVSTDPSWPFRTTISVPFPACQMRAVLSSDAVTTRVPSPLNPALDTRSAWLSERRSPCRSPFPRPAC